MTLTVVVVASGWTVMCLLLGYWLGGRHANQHWQIWLDSKRS